METTKAETMNGQGGSVDSRGRSLNRVTHYGWVVVDEPGEFRWIPKRLLFVDHDYQRINISRSKVLKLASEWSWVALGTLTVAVRDKSYFVVDGQHRKLAAEKRDDIDDLPCMVYRSDGQVSEAKGFLRTNTARKSLTMYDRWSALLRTQDPTALHVADLLASADYTPVDAGSSGRKTAKCLACLMLCTTNYREAMDAVWPVVIELHNGEFLHERVVYSLVYLENAIRSQGLSLTRSPWRARLLKLGREGVLEATMKAAVYYAQGGSRIWASGVVNALNHGLRNRLSMNPGEATDEVDGVDEQGGE